MHGTRRIAALANSVVLACSALMVGAVPGAAAINHVSVAVRCIWNPESLKITNNRSSNITITSVGSTYQKRAGEPYSVHKVLKPGRSITYTFGSGSGGNNLSSQFIFDDRASSEKATITTNLGTITKSCGN